jgi:hypothetical protein
MSSTAIAAAKIPDAQQPDFSARVEEFLAHHQRTIAITLCVFASLRILIFCAAFPLFNSTDEQVHFATVYEYAEGVPLSKDLPLLQPEVARICALYDSGEYMTPASIMSQHNLDAPIETLTQPLRDTRYARWMNYWSQQKNYESQSPPAYYALAGMWLKLGQGIGLTGWKLPYWVRFLNAALYFGFLWASYVFVQKMYRKRAFVCVGVLALLGVFPQDVFFGINRDVLSPLLGSLILLAFFWSLEKETSAVVPIALAGVLCGIAFLVDIANCVWVGALATVCYVRVRKVRNSAFIRREWLAAGLSLGVALLLPGLWMARNDHVIGDLTGSKGKMALFGWTAKSWNEILPHPIFTLHGVSYFLSQLTKTYWRGETFWYSIPMCWTAADVFYLVSTGLFLLAFFVYWRRSQPFSEAQKLSGLLSIYLIVSSVLFLAFLSLLFDFHQFPYPSRALPYFVSGRIIAGTLLPFAILYVLGFEYCAKMVVKRVHPIVPFTVCCLFLVTAEMVTSLKVFASPFNFFALWKI